LKEARARFGFTQEQLARVLRMHRLSVIRWEGGLHKMPHILELALEQIAREHCEYDVTEVKTDLDAANGNQSDFQMNKSIY
jgi:DNA-binding XRE family transcriptional regulator